MHIVRGHVFLVRTSARYILVSHLVPGSWRFSSVHRSRPGDGDIAGGYLLNRGADQRVGLIAVHGHAYHGRNILMAESGVGYEIERLYCLGVKGSIMDNTTVVGLNYLSKGPYIVMVYFLKDPAWD